MSTTANRRLRVNWGILRAEYISGAMTLEELAREHRLSSPAGLQRHAAKELWHKQRKERQAQLSRDAADAAFRDRKKELAAFNDVDLKAAKAIRAQALARFVRAQEAAQESTRRGELISPAELKLLADALKTAQHIGRLALGADDDEGKGAAGGGDAGDYATRAREALLEMQQATGIGNPQQ